MLNENLYKFFSQNIKSHVEGDESHFKLSYLGKLEYGYSEIYLLSKGAFISFNHIINCSQLPARDPSAIKLSNNLLIMHICLNGRCDLKLPHGNLIALSPKRLIFTSELTNEPLLYPESQFDGIEFFIDLDELEILDGNMLDMGNLDLQNFKDRFNVNEKPYFQFTNQMIDDLCNALWNTKGTDKIGKIRLLSSLLMQELLDLPKKSTVVSFLTKSQLSAVESAEAILCEDLSRKYTVNELAEKLHLNPSSLKKYFKLVHGVSLTTYVNNERIHYAKELLKNTDLPIADIAFQCGYENPGKFSQMFRKHCGVKPSEYRREQYLEKQKLR